MTKVKLNTKSALHLAYLVGIALKGVDGFIEVAGGALLLCISRPAIVHAITMLTRVELYEDPHDFVATHALHIVENLSPGTQHFASAYLLVHGTIKVGLVAALLRGWRQAYPVALLLLAAFIGYQGYRLFRYHSPMLAVFTAIDVAIVLLIWHEWKHHPTG